MRPTTRILAQAAATIAVVCLFIAPASAGKPTAGSGGKPSGGTGAAIVFSQDPVTVGSDYQIIGTGFGANRWVTVGAHYGEWTYWVSGVTDATGRIVLTTTARVAGTSYHEAKEQGNNGSLRLKATATLTVVG